MNCWNCGTQLIWNSDFDFEDYGYEGSGIVSLLICPNDDCQAEVEIRLPLDKKNKILK